MCKPDIVGVSRRCNCKVGISSACRCRNGVVAHGMDALDTFSRTFLPATALGKVPAGTVGRHVPVLRLA